MDEAYWAENRVVARIKADQLSQQVSAIVEEQRLKLEALLDDPLADFEDLLEPVVK